MNNPRDVTAQTIIEDNYNANSVQTWTISEEFAGQRLDWVLARLLPQHSRTRLQSAIVKGTVGINGVTCVQCKHKLTVEDVLTLDVDTLLETEPGAAIAEDIPLNIVHEDAEILVIHKPAGLVTHPGAGNWQGTLLNALLYYHPPLANIPRAGIVHRLDKDTSGLLVVAKTLTAQTDLVRQLAARQVHRRYWALVSGVPALSGEIDLPIGRDRYHRTKMMTFDLPQRPGAPQTVPDFAKPALTYYRRLEVYAFGTARCALMECRLATGRTHQIRVHMAALNHPLVGDAVYGRSNRQLPAFERQALHALALGLRHPATGEELSWQAPLPEDFRELLAICRAARVD